MINLKLDCGEIQMVYYTLENVIRDNNRKISSYRLKSLNNETIEVTPEELKNQLNSNKIFIKNLHIINNKLVYGEDIRNIVYNHKSLGSKIMEQLLEADAFRKYNTEIVGDILDKTDIKLFVPMLNIIKTQKITERVDNYIEIIFKYNQLTNKTYGHALINYNLSKKRAFEYYRLSFNTKHDERELSIQVQLKDIDACAMFIKTAYVDCVSSNLIYEQEICKISDVYSDIDNISLLERKNDAIEKVVTTLTNLPKTLDEINSLTGYLADAFGMQRAIAYLKSNYEVSENTIADYSNYLNSKTDIYLSDINYLKLIKQEVDSLEECIIKAPDKYGLAVVYKLITNNRHIDSDLDLIIISGDYLNTKSIISKTQQAMESLGETI